MNSKSKMNLMKITGMNSNKEENDNTLIDKYFKDQMDRNKCKKNAVTSQIDRKVYLRLYKQKQRESLLFKEMERKHKKATRESDEIRTKDKKSNLKSMGVLECLQILKQKKNMQKDLQENLMK